MSISAEVYVREFVAEFQTPNAKRALALCETGQLFWESVAALFFRSLEVAIAEQESRVRKAHEC